MIARWMSAGKVAAACATALALGCEEPLLRTAPVVTGPPSNPLAGFMDRSTGPWQFAGTVYEHTASASFRPLAGLRLRVSEFSNGAHLTRFVTSDDDGRYELTVGDTVKVEPALETAYLAPCPAGTDAPNWSGGATTFYMPDVHVVHQTVLSTTGTPDSLRSLSSSSVSGRVVTPAPSQTPIAGAHVELDNYGFVLSSTRSDTAGRFLLCSFPPGSGSDQTVIVRARKPGYRDGSREVAFFGAGDIELVPQ